MLRPPGAPGSGKAGGEMYKQLKKKFNKKKEGGDEKRKHEKRKERKNTKKHKEKDKLIYSQCNILMASLATGDFKLLYNNSVLLILLVWL
jgi:hypothetical protein